MLSSSDAFAKVHHGGSKVFVWGVNGNGMKICFPRNDVFPVPVGGEDKKVYPSRAFARHYL